MQTITTVKHLIPADAIAKEMIAYHEQQRFLIMGRVSDTRSQREIQSLYAQSSVHVRMKEFWSNVEIVPPSTVVDDGGIEGAV